MTLGLEYNNERLVLKSKRHDITFTHFKHLHPQIQYEKQYEINRVARHIRLSRIWDCNTSVPPRL